MDTLLIFAVAVAALILAFASAVSARARRPPLQMQREIDIAEGDEEAMIRTLRPAAKSPIDRTAPVLESEWRGTSLIDVGTIENDMIEADLFEDKRRRGGAPSKGEGAGGKRATPPEASEGEHGTR